AEETAQKCKAHFACDRERKCYKARTNTNLQQESELSVIAVNIEVTYLADLNIATTSQSKENINENEKAITATPQNNDIVEISIEA
ncbi:3984_t:CDS:1, partial [Cetraspora pellucida]